MVTLLSHLHSWIRQYHAYINAEDYSHISSLPRIIFLNETANKPSDSSSTIGHSTPAHSTSDGYPKITYASHMSTPDKRIIRLVSEYFNPFSKKVFVAHHYDPKRAALIGYLHVENPQPIWITCAKIISYFTLIIPLIMALAFLRYNAHLNYIVQKGKMDAAGRYVTKLIRAAIHRRKKIEAQHLFHSSVYIDSILKRERVGGEIKAGSHRLWINFEKHPPESPYSSLTIVALVPKTRDESQRIVTAQAHWDESTSLLTISQLQVNTSHPYLCNTTASNIQKLKADLAVQVFYTGVRFVIQQTKNNTGHPDYVLSRHQPAASGVSSGALSFNPSTSSFKSTTPVPLDDATAPNTFQFSSLTSPVTSDECAPQIAMLGDICHDLTIDGPDRIVEEEHFLPGKDHVPPSILAPANYYAQRAFSQLLAAPSLPQSTTPLL